MSFLKIQSSDGIIFEVEAQVADQSKVLKDFLINQNDEVIPLPNVNAIILEKIIEWCSYHKDDPRTTEYDDENREIVIDDISTWDVEFMNKVDQGTLFELILAANYLDIKSLLNVTCKTVANMIKSKTPDEVRKAFNIKNEITTEERLLMEKEKEWCEEK